MCILRGCPVQPLQNNCARRARAPKTSTPTTPKARSPSGRRRTTSPIRLGPPQSQSLPLARISRVLPARASFIRVVFRPFYTSLNPALAQMNCSFVRSLSGSLVFVAPSLAHRRTRLSYFCHFVILSTVSYVGPRPPTLSPRPSPSPLAPRVHACPTRLVTLAPSRPPGPRHITGIKHSGTSRMPFSPFPLPLA